MTRRTNAKGLEGSSAQAAHRIYLNPAAFRELSLALHHLSVRELKLCSARRLVTSVLEDPLSKIYGLSFSDLDRICCADALTGNVRINIRIASSVNDRLRAFRNYAEGQLGRPVTVVEAINACAVVINRAH